MTKLIFFALVLALDGGTAAPPPQKHDAGRAHQQVSDEDKELLENLELLQDMDQASDLELLQELSVER